MSTTRVKTRPSEQNAKFLACYLLTVPEAAERLSVSAKCIWNWVYSGKIPVVRLSEKCVRIPSDAIEKLILDSLVPARPEVL